MPTLAQLHPVHANPQPLDAGQAQDLLGAATDAAGGPAGVQATGNSMRFQANLQGHVLEVAATLGAAGRYRVTASTWKTVRNLAGLVLGREPVLEYEATGVLEGKLPGLLASLGRGEL